MIHRSLTAAIVTGILALATLGQAVEKANQPLLEEILERQVKGEKFDDVTTREAFSSALGAMHMSGGIVIVPDCNGKVRYNLVTSAAPSLRDILDGITLTEPIYRWEVKDGVVNIVPRSGIPELLETNIAKFEIKNADTSLAVNRLLALQSVRRRMADLNLSEGPLRSPGLGYFSPDGKSDKKKRGFDVRVQNVTLRDALNAI